MSDEDETPQPEQPSARLTLLRQQASDLTRQLLQLGVPPQIADPQFVRQASLPQALFTMLVSKGIVTVDEAEETIMEACVLELENALHAVEEQQFKKKRQIDLALPEPPRIPPGVLGSFNGHRH